MRHPNPDSSFILKTLAIYRLGFGQPRQAELVEQLIGREFTPEELRQVIDRLLIDLSPISAGKARAPSP